MKHSTFFRKTTAFMAVFFTVTALSLSLPLPPVHAADLSAVTDSLTPEEIEFFYENFPELIQGIAGSVAEDVSSRAMASKYDILPAVAQNPALYLYPGQTVEFPIIYTIPGDTPVTPGPNQYMYFQLLIQLPSVSGVKFYVDNAFATYQGQKIYTSYTSNNNYYFIIPPYPALLLVMEAF